MGEARRRNPDQGDFHQDVVTDNSNPLFSILKKYGLEIPQNLEVDAKKAVGLFLRRRFFDRGGLKRNNVRYSEIYQNVEASGAYNDEFNENLRNLEAEAGPTFIFGSGILPYLVSEGYHVMGAFDVSGVDQANKAEDNRIFGDLLLKTVFNATRTIAEAHGFIPVRVGGDEIAFLTLNKRLAHDTNQQYVEMQRELHALLATKKALFRDGDNLVWRPPEVRFSPHIPNLPSARATGELRSANSMMEELGMHYPGLKGLNLDNSDAEQKLAWVMKSLISDPATDKAMSNIQENYGIRPHVYKDWEDLVYKLEDDATKDPRKEKHYSVFQIDINSVLKRLNGPRYATADIKNHYEAGDKFIGYMASIITQTLFKTLGIKDAKLLRQGSDWVVIIDKDKTISPLEIAATLERKFGTRYKATGFDAEIPLITTVKSGSLVIKAPDENKKLLFTPSKENQIAYSSVKGRVQEEIWKSSNRGLYERFILQRRARITTYNVERKQLSSLEKNSPGYIELYQKLKYELKKDTDDLDFLIDTLDPTDKRGYYKIKQLGMSVNEINVLKQNWITFDRKRKIGVVIDILSQAYAE